MNEPLQLFIDFFIRQTQISRLQLDHWLNAWLQQPEACHGTQHICVLLSYAESLCQQSGQDPDGKRIRAILETYWPHEQKMLTERRIDQLLIRGMRLRLSLPEIWQEQLPQGNEEIARQILEVAAEQTGQPEIPHLWQHQDRRIPSTGVFDYIMVLLAIAQHFDWPQLLDRVKDQITATIDSQRYAKTCTQHRWIGPFSALGDSWPSKAEDIAYQILYRPGYPSRTLKQDASPFFQTLLLFLQKSQHPDVLRFLAYLSMQQANQSRQTRRFTTRFSLEELDIWLAELLNQQKLLVLLERAKASDFQPLPGLKLDSQHLAEQLNADILGSRWPEHNYTTYSLKRLETGSLFIAFDNNWSASYRSRKIQVQRAFEYGARTVIASREQSSDIKRTAEQSLLLVDNTFSALIKLATARRTVFSGRMVAITGSVGKSSVAQMLYHTSIGLRKSYKNIPHFNNQAGVSISLINIPDHCELAVIEMGMGDVLTILPMSILARPHIAIVTDIQEDHLQFHRSMESIVYTKMEIIEGLEPGGWLILNRDSPYYPLMLGIAQSRGIQNLLTFGQHPLADVCLQQITLRADESQLRVCVDHGCFDYHLALPGIHMAINSLAVIAAHLALGWPLEKILPRFATAQPVESRNQQLQVQLHDGRELLLIDDSFSINPASLLACIHRLSLSEPGTGGRRIMVIYDMEGMGEKAEEYHELIAPAINQSNIDCFYSIGRYTRLIHNKLAGRITHRHCQSQDEMVEALLMELRHGDVVAFKGSARAATDTTMEQVIARIKQA